jgi:hypothetical protein
LNLRDRPEALRDAGRFEVKKKHCKEETALAAPVTVRTDEVHAQEYGQDGQSCEPSPADIARHVAFGEVEMRPFQTYAGQLALEWYSVSGPERIALATRYHTMRVAYFVIKGWDDPIKVVRTNYGYLVTEGAHRIRAARFKGMESVLVQIDGDETQSVAP